MAPDTTRHTNDLTRRVFDSMRSHGILVFDHEMRYAMVEGGVLTKLGYTPEVMLGRTLYDVLDPSSAAKLSEMYARALAGESFDLDYYSERDDTHYRLYFGPIRDARGKVEFGRILCEETTADASHKRALEDRLVRLESESRQSLENTRQLRQLIDVAPFAIAMFDRRMCYLAYSQNWLSSYGLDPEQELTGRSHYEVFPEIGERWKDDHRRVLAGETLEKDEDPFERQDGSVDYVQWRNVPWYDEDGGVGGMIMFTQVVTSRVETLHELSRRTTSLALKNDELAETIAELEQVNAELERFAYVASHDLQEPLRMVHSYTQVLASRLEEHLDEDTRRYMGYVTEGSQRMRELIDDLLALSRITTREVPLQTASLGAPLREALTHMKATLDERGALVEVDELPQGNFAYTHIYQVFLNLLSNAVKFTPPERAPVIEVRVDTSGETPVVSVADQGIGVESKDHEVVFEPFRRLHPRQQYEGNGIGLSIVKKIVRRHGGSVSVTSNANGGTTVWFTLPDAFDTSPDE